MMGQLDIFEVAAARGIQRARDSQERREPGWTELAYEEVVRFMMQHAEYSFMANEATDWIRANSTLAQPPELRAWGAVFRRLKRFGRIAYLGHERVAARHHTPQVRWRIVR